MPHGMFEEQYTSGNMRMKWQQLMGDTGLEEVICEMERENPQISTI